MPQNPDPASQKLGTLSIVVLTPKETAGRLKVSTSWLAKARMRGDGPTFIKIGRAIRYPEAALIQWMKRRQRLSTSEQ
jgi:predicted DNA-binding transcriptional regulator AlpA